MCPLPPLPLPRLYPPCIGLSQPVWTPLSCLTFVYFSIALNDHVLFCLGFTIPSPVCCPSSCFVSFLVIMVTMVCPPSFIMGSTPFIQPISLFCPITVNPPYLHLPSCIFFALTLHCLSCYSRCLHHPSPITVCHPAVVFFLSYSSSPVVCFFLYLSYTLILPPLF